MPVLTKTTSETAFEIIIEKHLLSNDYQAISSKEFDKERAIFPSTVLDFIKATQAKEWAKLEVLHGKKTGEQVLGDLCAWMNNHGVLATLSHGFKCYGRKLRIAYFKAVQTMVTTWLASEAYQKLREELKIAPKPYGVHFK